MVIWGTTPDQKNLPRALISGNPGGTAVVVGSPISQNRRQGDEDDRYAGRQGVVEQDPAQGAPAAAGDAHPGDSGGGRNQHGERVALAHQCPPSENDGGSRSQAHRRVGERPAHRLGSATGPGQLQGEGDPEDGHQPGDSHNGAAPARLGIEQ